MDNQEILKFKTRLEQEKKEIEKELKGFEKLPELGDEGDPDIETQETQEYGNQLSLAQIHKARLIEINSALERIESGKYGICENCKKEISEDLLKLVPESRYCRDCKKLSKAKT